MGSGKVATVAELTIGAPQSALNLTMFPLSGNPASSLGYLLIDEALKIKKVVVEEESESGTVPELNLLRLIKEKKPASLHELARLSNRNIKNISDDMKFLAQMGLVELKKSEKKILALVNYDKILLEIAV